MRNLLLILLAMFVGISVVGCASYQKLEKESLFMCDYSYRASTPVDYSDIFYSDLTLRMRGEGFSPVRAFRGRLFKREFIINRNEYILFVEVSVVSQVDEYNVSTQVPYYTISLKKRNILGINFKCVTPVSSVYLFYDSTVSKIVNESAQFSQKKNWIEEKDIPVGGL